MLKEYIARGTYIYPPEPSPARSSPTSFRFCAAEVPSWNPISISGYHIREAGATAVQELAFTFANAIEYVRRALAAGLAIDAFAPRLSFFFAAHNDLFEEVAKFRAARRMYARLMRERFGASEQAARLRFHTQTGGVTLTAQQPLNNVVRVTMQALAATLGGTQSLHTNGYDEALAAPHRARRPRSRCGRSRSSRTSRASPTRWIRWRGATTWSRSPTRWRHRPLALIGEGRRAGRRGGGDRGRLLPGRDRAQRVRAAAAGGVAGRRVVVGVNRFADDAERAGGAVAGLRRRWRPSRWTGCGGSRAARDARRRRPHAWLRSAPRRAAYAPDVAASGTPAARCRLIIDAVRARATVGEIADTLRRCWGHYTPANERRFAIVHDPRRADSFPLTLQAHSPPACRRTTIGAPTGTISSISSGR